MEPSFNEQDVDYKEMYLTMARAAESAIRTLIEAQQKCEELYMSAGMQPPEKNQGPARAKPCL